MKHSLFLLSLICSATALAESPIYLKCRVHHPSPAGLRSFSIRASQEFGTNVAYPISAVLTGSSNEVKFSHLNGMGACELLSTFGMDLTCEHDSAPRAKLSGLDFYQISLGGRYHTFIRASVNEPQSPAAQQRLARFGSLMIQDVITPEDGLCKITPRTQF